MIWLGLLAIAAAAVLLLAVPLFRRGSAADDGRRSVYRDQLRELDREVASGRMAAGEAGAARLEIQRRLLAVDRSAGDGTIWSGQRGILVPVACLILAGPLAVYLSLGQPAMPDHPLSERTEETAELQALDQAIAGFRARLAANPQDHGALAKLAQSLALRGHDAEALEQVQAARQVLPGRSDLASLLGDLLTRQAGGLVTAEARANFAAALAGDPSDFRARYHLALAQEQAGDGAGALTAMTALWQATPADAPWRGMVQEKITRLAQGQGRDPAALLTRTGGPDAASMQAMAALPEAERAGAIAGMVVGLAERLARQPEDVDGWLRLARARATLGDRAGALAALGEASTRAPGRVDLHVSYARALLPSDGTGASLPPQLGDLYRRILALDPDQPEALWFAGVFAAEAGDRVTARQRWSHLLSLMPPAVPERQSVQQALDGLGS